MARIKRTLIVRKASGEVKRKDIYVKQRAVKRPTPKMWERALMVGDTSQQRKQLTGSQWREYSELRRSLPNTCPDIILDEASLDTLRDLQYSTTRMQIIKVVHEHRTAM